MMQPTSKQLFDGSLAPGTYRLVAPAREIVASLEKAGWRTGVLAQGDTREDFLANVGTALQFPHWYGRNLDALWDCLRDLEAPTALVWTSWHELAINHPQDWAQLLSLLQERTQNEPAFALVLA